MAPKQKIVTKKHVARLERERRQVRLIQYIAIGVVLAVILILAYGFIDINILQARAPVAEVNGEPIRLDEFQARVVLQRNELISQYMQYSQFQQFGMDVTAQLQQIEVSMSSPPLVGQEVLNTMIYEELIRQEAAEREVTILEDELESFIREQFRFFPDGTPTPAPTPTQIEYSRPTLSPEQLALVTPTPVPTEGPTTTPFPTLTSDPAIAPEATATITPTPFPTPTATPYTLEGYQTQYEEVLAGMEEYGLTAEQYRNLFVAALMRTKLADEVVVELPQEEEQVWARHILVADEEAAQEVIERLENGEDFGTLAVELSEDPGSGSRGGDLGWFGKGQMVPVFETTAFSLEVGEISEPVQSDFGWHIIQTLGYTTVPLSSNALEQERQSAFDEFLNDVYENADIVIHDEVWQPNVPTSPNLEEVFGSPFPSQQQ